MKEVSTAIIAEYLQKIGIECSIDGDRTSIVRGFSSIFNYRPDTMTFIVPERNFESYSSSFTQQKIALMIMHKDEIKNECFISAIRVKSPRKAFFSVIDRFFDIAIDDNDTCLSTVPEVYRTRSFISEDAQIGKNVKIGVGCVIEANVEIGDDTEIHHNVVIRSQTKIGKNCTILSGAIIGEIGFNYTIDEDGTKHMIKHYGGVTIEDDVHIGDNCCIIRGTIDDTVIKRGVKINTMAHIAHNDVIGENTVITVSSRICGSVNVGKNCYVAAGYIRNQVSIGDYAVLGLGAVIVKDVETGDKVVGNPARSVVGK